MHLPHGRLGQISTDKALTPANKTRPRKSAVSPHDDLMPCIGDCDQAKLHG